MCNIYGITGDASDWFRSYLTGRIQRVVIEDDVSVDQGLGFGVPQGSVLGPKIYCMYTKPVSDIIQRHELSHHSYADDTQLYMTMDHSNNNWRDGLARIQLCVSEGHNRLSIRSKNSGTRAQSQHVFDGYVLFHTGQLADISTKVISNLIHSRPGAGQSIPIRRSKLMTTSPRPQSKVTNSVFIYLLFI